MLIRKGLVHQRGSGFGSFIQGLLKIGKPIVKTILGIGKRLLGVPIVRNTVKDVGQSALSVGVKSLGDILQGESLKKSVVKNAKEAKTGVKKRFVDRLVNVTTQSPKKRRLETGKGGKKKKKKKLNLTYLMRVNNDAKCSAGL